MKQYLLVVSNTLQDYFAYRLNFFLWRARVLISILISYFLWLTIFMSKNQVFGYTQSRMLTYILLITFIHGAVLSTQTFRIAEDINIGRLSNLLLKPINYFGYVLAKDVSDKALNIIFAFFELGFLIVVLNPPIIRQTNFYWLSIFLLAVFLAAILYFEIGMLLSFVGFWSREIWAPRFIFSIIVTFLAGVYFPLDILPSFLHQILLFLPFPYLAYFPIKLYLAETNSPFIITGFFMMFFWIIVLWIALKHVWQKGLKLYRAEGG